MILYSLEHYFKTNPKPQTKFIADSHLIYSVQFRSAGSHLIYSVQFRSFSL